MVEATESRSSTVLELTISRPLLHHEALNNVAGHAHAAHAWVRFEQAPGHVCLSVGDGGEGFADGPVAATHLGLRSMRERAEEAGARFHLASSAGGGKLVTVEWRAGNGEGGDEDGDRAGAETRRAGRRS